MTTYRGRIDASWTDANGATVPASGRFTISGKPGGNVNGSITIGEGRHEATTGFAGRADDSGYFVVEGENTKSKYSPGGPLRLAVVVTGQISDAFVDAVVDAQYGPNRVEHTWKFRQGKGGGTSGEDGAPIVHADGGEVGVFEAEEYGEPVPLDDESSGITAADVGKGAAILGGVVGALYIGNEARKAAKKKWG